MPGLDPFLDGLDYPVFVVTTVHPGTGELSGCLVGFATQCSIDPERFLVCLSVANHTYRVALHATHLGVHVLGRGQRALADLFGGETGDEVDKFDRCEWRPGPGGVPLLADCTRWFAGRILDRMPLGDHAGYVLDVVASDGTGGGPLMFSSVRDVEPGHDP